MKTTRINGGTATLWRASTGWSYQYFKSHRDPPSEVMIGGKTLYFRAGTMFGVGDAPTLRVARQAVHRMLQP